MDGCMDWKNYKWSPGINKVVKKTKTFSCNKVDEFQHTVKSSLLSKLLAAVYIKVEKWEETAVKWPSDQWDMQSCFAQIESGKPLN